MKRVQLDSESKEYKVSTAIVNKMHGWIDDGMGVILTQIEASMPSDSQQDALKSLVKRHFNDMRYKIQDVIYQEWGVQERDTGETYPTDI